MRADAAARSIPPEELRGATITLSNFGMIAGHFAGLVVVPPQVAIVGAAAPNSALSSKAANRRDPDPGASNSSPFRGVGVRGHNPSTGLDHRPGLGASVSDGVGINSSIGRGSRCITICIDVWNSGSLCFTPAAG